MKTTTPAPRKSPKQERSRATATAILQATTYILRAEGYDALSTNRIAARAGVNIASLYQYFPNKEAIVAELQRQHFADSARAARAVMARACPPSGWASAEIPTVVRALVQVVIACHAVDPGLHALFADDLPKPQRLPESLSFEEFAPLAEAIEAQMTGAPRPALTRWLVWPALHAPIHQAAIQQSALLHDPAFAAEIEHLLLGFLQRPRSATTLS